MLVGVALDVLVSAEIVALVFMGLDVLIVVSGVAVKDDSVTGGALPVTIHEQAEEIRDRML